MPKLNKTQKPVTPQELSRFNDKSTTASELERYHVRTDSAEIVAYKKRRNLLSIIIGVGVFILIILFIISMIITHWGDLVIEVDSFAGKKGLALSEDPNFGERSSKLSAVKAVNVTHYTKSWLPSNLDNEKNGEHNGKSYVAYTFYIKNVGKETLNYDASLEIMGAALSADEAVRVMVYKNGEERVYGKAKLNNREESEKDCYKFVYSSDDDKGSIVMTTRTENFEVDQIDKYTIVVWMEGEDPECVDKIRSGYVRMRMLFEVESEETPHSIFGAAYEQYVESRDAQQEVDDFGFEDDTLSASSQQVTESTAGTSASSSDLESDIISQSG